MYNVLRRATSGVKRQGTTSTTASNSSNSNSIDYTTPWASTSSLGTRLASNGASSSSTTTTTTSSGVMVRRRKREPVLKLRMELEHTLGLTSNNNVALAAHPTQDQVAYLAGSVVVIYDHRRHRQVGLLSANAPYTPLPGADMGPSHGCSGLGMAPSFSGSALNLAAMVASGASLSSSSPSEVPSTGALAGLKKHAQAPLKTLACVVFSPDGNYVAAGEIGHQPRILVWDLHTKNLVAQMSGHRFGIMSLSFSPNMKYIISCGAQASAGSAVLDRLLIGLTPLQHDGFLYVWNWRQGIKVASNKISNRVHALTFSKDGSFCVTSGQRFVKYWYFDANGNIPDGGDYQSRHAVRVLRGRSGVLADLRDCTFQGAACGRGMSGAEYTYLVSSTGLLCLFVKDRKLDRWADMKVPSAGCLDVCDRYVVCGGADGTVRIFEPVTLKYIATLPKPHPLGVQFDQKTARIPSGIADAYPDCVALRIGHCGRKITCVYSDRSLYVWDVTDLPRIGRCRSLLFHSAPVWGVETLPTAKANEHSFPPNTFVTYSSDGSVRFWNMHPMRPSGQRSLGGRELLKTFYAGVEWPLSISRREPLPRHSFSSTNAVESAMPGVRSLSISPDARYMATGDRAGNLRVHEMATFKQLIQHEAHDAEILTIGFSTPTKNSDFLLASAGRDRLVHIFDVRNAFRPLQTLDDHSSSITAIQFSDRGRRLMSCGADKSIIFRSRQESTDGSFNFANYHLHSGRMTLYDMDIDHQRHQIAVTQNRRISMFDVVSGKPTSSEGADSLADESPAAEGILLRVALDPSGSYAVSAGSDKRVRLHDLGTGATLACMGGHSELVTGVRFTRDCTRIVSTSGDGCVFVWRIARSIVEQMRSRAVKRGIVLAPLRTSSQTSAPDLVPEDEEVGPAYPTAVPLHPRLRRQVSADGVHSHTHTLGTRSFGGSAVDLAGSLNRGAGNEDKRRGFGTSVYGSDGLGGIGGGGRRSSDAGGASSLRATLRRFSKHASTTDLPSSNATDYIADDVSQCSGGEGDDMSGTESDPEFFPDDSSAEDPNAFHVTHTHTHCTTRLTPSPSLDSDDKEASDRDDVPQPSDDETETVDGAAADVSLEEYLCGPVPVTPGASRNSITMNYLETMRRTSIRVQDLFASALTASELPQSDTVTVERDDERGATDLVLLQRQYGSSQDHDSIEQSALDNSTVATLDVNSVAGQCEMLVVEEKRNPSRRGSDATSIHGEDADPLPDQIPMPTADPVCPRPRSVSPVEARVQRRMARAGGSTSVANFGELPQPRVGRNLLSNARVESSASRQRVNAAAAHKRAESAIPARRPASGKTRIPQHTRHTSITSTVSNTSTGSEARKRRDNTAQEAEKTGKRNENLGSAAKKERDGLASKSKANTTAMPAVHPKGSKASRPARLSIATGGASGRRVNTRSPSSAVPPKKAHKGTEEDSARKVLHQMISARDALNAAMDAYAMLLHDSNTTAEIGSRSGDVSAITSATAAAGDAGTLGQIHSTLAQLQGEVAGRMLSLSPASPLPGLSAGLTPNHTRRSSQVSVSTTTTDIAECFMRPENEAVDTLVESANVDNGPIGYESDENENDSAEEEEEAEEEEDNGNDADDDCGDEEDESKHISKCIDSTSNKDDATRIMLERYSEMLLRMVENKLENRLATAD
ncbi:hypothetical protein THASP1DRAFT_29578 [Thamnocephalis sphaerospora]|uniref:MABP1/WDR62 second WD40 domain-containing protein n=1 Tax=Thamnocephalis sphaerospora TaxID=78915 RepID=A0A4P9XT79_9FUNG|nr:hypothetical protein THASP1DRAFT_29578 [Thamnocephalis sphaerospora]|eukprot:RKP08630.1 hypothetical protein THASP1DRAFT_29578 [Thamnocephalis sphaerospora]